MEQNQGMPEQPTNPVVAALEQAEPVQPTPAPVQAVPAPKKKSSTMVLVIILLLLVAAGGVGFGVWAMMDGNSRVETAKKNCAASSTEVITKCDVDADTKDEETDNTISSDSSYIYIAEWGIKIKKPDNLKAVSYLVDYRFGEDASYLYINGTVGDESVSTEFLNTSIDDKWLGAVARIAHGVTQDYIGTFVTTVGEYDYYYGHPQDVKSTDSQQQQIETQTVDAIQTVLTNAENYIAF